MLLDLIDPARESGGSQTTKPEFSIKPYLISIEKESIIVTCRLTKLSPQTAQKGPHRNVLIIEIIKP